MLFDRLIFSEIEILEDRLLAVVSLLVTVSSLLTVVAFLFSTAIFIVDAIHEVYLWLGWWPEDDDESENTDAQRLRWDIDKRKAMESVVLYAQGNCYSLTYPLMILCYSLDHCRVLICYGGECKALCFMHKVAAIHTPTPPDDTLLFISSLQRFDLLRG